MRTDEILQLDCRESENEEIIQKVLRQIKPLSKYSEDDNVPLSALEKAITVMTRKYDVRLNYMIPDAFANGSTNTVWRVTLIDDATLHTVKCVYGLSIYELLAKATIAMFALVRSNTIGLRK